MGDETETLTNEDALSLEKKLEDEKRTKERYDKENRRVGQFLCLFLGSILSFMTYAIFFRDLVNNAIFDYPAEPLVTLIEEAVQLGPTPSVSEDGTTYRFGVWYWEQFPTTTVLNITIKKESRSLVIQDYSANGLNSEDFVRTDENRYRFSSLDEETRRLVQGQYDRAIEVGIRLLPDEIERRRTQAETEEQLRLHSLEETVYRLSD